jgi:hypothetical protein
MALSKDRKTKNAIGRLCSYLVAATTKIYEGSLVAINSSGYAVPASANNTLKVVGVAQAQADNTSGSAGDINVLCRDGLWGFTNGGDIAAADAEKICFASADDTVYLSDSSGTRPAAGKIKFVDPVNDQVFIDVAAPSLFAVNPEVSAASTAGLARGMGPASNVADLAAFTVASNDGLTYVAGDVVVLYAQTTAAQNGPYVVGTVASGVAPLTRPDWWAAGAALTTMHPIEVRAGTLFAGTTWKSTAASGVVDTADPAIFPRVVTQPITLSSGVLAVTNVPIKSATKTQFVFSRTTASTPSNTVQYNPVSITAGAAGTASVTCQAQVAAGTVNASDASVGNFSIINQL